MQNNNEHDGSILEVMNKKSAASKIQRHWRGYSNRSKNVLEPCNPSELDIDYKKLEECLRNDYLTQGRMEYYKNTSTKNLTLEDGFMEYILAKCIDGDRVGEGNCPVDVVKNDFGIDVLCVCLKGNKTNEKSIMQNFGECGKNLDSYFVNEKYQEALYLFKKEYYKKLFTAKTTKKLNRLYYCAFISTDINIYLSVFKINIEHILNMKYETITKTKKNIKFKGFINKKLGMSTLYKSKKRLEIRLSKNVIECFNTIKIL